MPESINDHDVKERENGRNTMELSDITIRTLEERNEETEQKLETHQELKDIHEKQIALQELRFKKYQEREKLNDLICEKQRNLIKLLNIRHEESEQKIKSLELQNHKESSKTSTLTFLDTLKNSGLLPNASMRTYDGIGLIIMIMMVILMEWNNW